MSETSPIIPQYIRFPQWIISEEMPSVVPNTNHESQPWSVACGNFFSYPHRWLGWQISPHRPHWAQRPVEAAYICLGSEDLPLENLHPVHLYLLKLLHFNSIIKANHFHINFLKTPSQGEQGCANRKYSEVMFLLNGKIRTNNSCVTNLTTFPGQRKYTTGVFANMDVCQKAYLGSYNTSMNWIKLGMGFWWSEFVLTHVKSFLKCLFTFLLW